MTEQKPLDVKVKVVSEKEYINLLEKKYKKILKDIKTNYSEEYKKFMGEVSDQVERIDGNYEEFVGYLNEESIVIPNELKSLYRVLTFNGRDIDTFNFTITIIKSRLDDEFSEEFKKKIRKLFDILITAKEYLISNLPPLKYCMIRIDDTVYISMEYARKELIHFVVNVAEQLLESNIKDPLDKIMSETSKKKIAMIYPTAVWLEGEKLKNPEQYPFYFVESLGIEEPYELFHKFYSEGIMPRLVKKLLYIDSKETIKKILAFLNRENTLYSMVMRHFILENNVVLMETKFTYSELKELGITDEEIVFYQIGGSPGNKVMAKILSYVEHNEKEFQKTLLYTLAQKVGYEALRKIYDISAVSGDKQILKYIENYIPHSLLFSKIGKLKNPQDLAFAVVLHAVQGTVMDKERGLAILGEKGSIIQEGYSKLYPELKEKFIKSVIELLNTRGVTIEQKINVIERNVELFVDVFSDYKANLPKLVKKVILSLTNNALLKITSVLDKEQVADLWNYAITNGTESKAVLLANALNSSSNAGKHKKVKLTF